MKKLFFLLALISGLASAAPAQVNIQRVGGTNTDKFDVTTNVTIPAGKTLDVSAGTVTFANNQIPVAKVNGALTSADISGKANLAGGNTFTGNQNFGSGQISASAANVTLLRTNSIIDAGDSVVLAEFNGTNWVVAGDGSALTGVVHGWADLSGVTMSVGSPSLPESVIIAGLGEAALLRGPQNGMDTTYTVTLPSGTGTLLLANGSGASLTGITGTQVANTPAGGIAATNVQAALNELDSEKAAGPASSVDNTIPRFDGTGGKTLQTSQIRADDNGDLVVLVGDVKVNNGSVTTIGLTTSTITNFGMATINGIITNPGGLAGVTNGSDSTAGNVGEYVESKVAVGSAVSLTTATAANVTSISLTAGDWDVEANVNYALTLATVTAKAASTSTTSATLATDGSESYSGVVTSAATTPDSIALTRKRISVTTTTTVYLVARATFTGTSVGGYGFINARRVR